MAKQYPGNQRGRSRIRAARFFVQTRDAGYDRTRDLPRLIPLLTRDLDTPSIADHRRLVALLRRALRAERLRSRQLHWTYDPARHSALARATRIENAALRRRCELLGIHQNQ